ncbi:MAG TPA: ATP-binding protein [Rhabdochlamydiaceae bacterium]|nr:ATP-binding protein [Rhabdochlamydiaceae bacterium]
MFIGREFELQKLQEFKKRNVAGIVVICGRRRIGKSTLVEHFASRIRFLEFYGLAPREGLTPRDQLDHFSELLGLAFQLPSMKFNNWNHALDMLASLTMKGEVIIFFDEISWMAGSDKDFVGKLKGVWDTKFKKNPQLILILCGSVTSWIEKNILNDKGFMGRVSLTLKLEEMPLSDANKFWGKHLVASREKFKVCCVTGGVPRYLEEIQPQQSAEQNIKRLCFSKGGILLDEFDKIFRDIFAIRADDYREIVKILANGSCELEVLCDKLGVKPTGGLSKKLQILDQSGFITRDYVWEKSKKKSKLSKFRLRDNYLRFYLKYIEPKKHLIEQGLYDDLFLEDLPEWNTIVGFQFENLVLNNLSAVQHFLQIPSSSVFSAAPYFQKKTKRQEACQIDLLIQCRYAIYLCEIKSCQKIFPEVIDEVSEKICKLSLPKGISIRPILIYQGEISPKIAQANFFTHLISFEQFLYI